MRRSCVILACLLFGACATTPPPRSPRVYLYQDPVAALDMTWARIEEAHWLECDIEAERAATQTFQGKQSAGQGLLGMLIAIALERTHERERDIDYAQTMKKCLAAKGYAVRPAIVPPTASFSDTPEQSAAKQAAWDKWGPEQYRLLLEEAAERAHQ